MMVAHLTQLTLLICLQYSENHFWGGDVSGDILYVSWSRVDLICVVFLR